MIKGSDWGGSRLVCAQTCKQKYYNRYERPNDAGGQGIVRLEDSYAASKGTLLHTFWQTYYNTLIANPEGDKREAGLLAIKTMLEEIPKFNITFAKAPFLQDEVIAAADQYLQHYAVDSLVPLATEVELSIEIEENGVIHTHTGIIDLLCEWNNAPFVVDHKTTSKTFAALFNSYTNNLSFKGYCKAASKKYGKQVGVMINGLRFKNNKALEVEFEREPYMYNEKDFSDFNRTVHSVRREIDMCKADEFWPKSGDQCVQPWGTCEYFSLCKFDDPAMVNALYKPVTKGEPDVQGAVGE